MHNQTKRGVLRPTSPEPHSSAQPAASGSPKPSLMARISRRGVGRAGGAAGPSAAAATAAPGGGSGGQVAPGPGGRRSHYTSRMTTYVLLVVVVAATSGVLYGCAGWRAVACGARGSCGPGIKRCVHARSIQAVLTSLLCSFDLAVVGGVQASHRMLICSCWAASRTLHGKRSGCCTQALAPHISCAQAVGEHGTCSQLQHMSSCCCRCLCAHLWCRPWRHSSRNSFQSCMQRRPAAAWMSTHVRPLAGLSPCSDRLPARSLMSVVAQGHVGGWGLMESGSSWNCQEGSRRITSAARHSVGASTPPQPPSDCKYEDTMLQLYNSVLFLAGAIVSIPAGYAARAYGRKVRLRGGADRSRCHAAPPAWQACLPVDMCLHRPRVHPPPWLHPCPAAMRSLALTGVG